MKYNYQFKVADIEGAKRLKIEIQDPGLHLVSNLLTYDVPTYPTHLIEVLEAVLSGDTHIKYWGGLVTELEITREQTKVFDKHSHENCTIETDELRQLVNIFIQEEKQFVQLR